MTINFQCSNCGKSYRLSDELAGRKVRCKGCDAVFMVPRQDEFENVVEEDLFEKQESEAEESPPRKPNRSRTSPRDSDERSSTPSKSSKVRKGKKPSNKSVWSSPWTWIGIAAGGLLTCLLICCGGVPYLLQRSLINKSGVAVDKVPLGPATSLMPVGQVPIPTFPDLGEPKVLEPSGVKVYTITMLQKPGAEPGHSMMMRVYLPATDVPAKSIPCVLIAPAGSTLLQGNSIDDPDYHDETLPYAEAGMAVVNYSLDGGTLNHTDNFVVQLTTGYLQFRAAMAGVVNGRNAFEFALARLNSVDPKKIYAAGHSSAGTAALLLAAHEPRLAGTMAFAPCSDLEARMGELDGYVSRTFLYDLTHFLKQTSPKTHVGQINCPAFLFHAEDDGNVPVSDTRSFASELKGRGINVDLKIVPTGDHYDSMIKEGVPAAVEWLKQRQ